MIYLLIFFLLTVSIAQTLSPEEQKLLIEENKYLKEQLQKKNSEPESEEAKKMMNALQKGKAFQEEQNKALEELDKED